MAQIFNGIFHIPGRDEFLPDAHTYIIGNIESGDLTLIDPGLAGKGAYKLDAMKKLGIDSELVKRIILTHTHLDHIGCLEELKKEMPHAEIWMHRTEAEQVEAGDDRTVYGMEMFKGMCQAQFRFGPDAFKFKVDRKLEGGEILEIGGMTWEVLFIPGHSMGGIALYEPTGKILIPGDVVYADYAIGRFDLFAADSSQLKASLNRLAELEMDILLPGHNQIMKGVPKGYIKKTAKMWEGYL